MKKLLLIILLVIIASVIVIGYVRKNKDSPVTIPKENTQTPKDSDNPAFTLKQGDYTFTFNHQNKSRLYIAHVPPSYNTASPIPVVLFLHGGGGKAEGLDELSGFSNKADEEEFIVVYPEGTSKPLLKTSHSWNTGNCEGISNTKCSNPAIDAQVDDVGYIHKVLDDLESKFNIDTKRIYATGFSNGGQMSHRLGCEMSERLAAIAPVSGTLLQNPCNPTRAIPILNIYARNDENVPYEGGIGQCTTADFSWPSVSRTMDIWKNNNRVSANPVSVYENNTVHCESHRGSDTEVQICTVEPNQNDWKIGGHSWPGAPEYPVGLCLALTALKCPCIPTEDLHATDYIWDFFEKYSL